MGWFILKHIFSTMFSFITIGRLSEQDKDLEILVLRQQLSILQRKLDHPIRPSRVEKMTLAVLTTKIKQLSHRATDQLQDVIRIFQPETILRWHRELVRRNWTYPNKNKGGRPATSKEIENLILRLARENSRWGYGRIQGELRKLSFRVSETSIRNILDRHGILPAPARHGSLGWRYLMNHYKEQILACDFFTVETILLQTIYVFFFIELGSRRVHFAGITTHPNQFWVTQQARQLVWQLSDGDTSFRFLIHDNDRSLCLAFDTVFKSEGFHVIKTPFQAPNANSFAERWVRTAREECLDLILIFNAAHLRRVMLEFVDYYNFARPHQGIHQQSPIPYHLPAGGSIQCRNILGGIIHDYFRDPTCTVLSSA
jgi:putative transposase